jgi:hypothetical protein
MAEPVLPEDLRDAPPEVQQSARWLEKNQRQRYLYSFTLAAVALGTLFATGLGHDVLGWSELQSLVVFGSGMLVLGGTVIVGLTSSLRHVPLHAAVVARYRELKRLGLLSAPPPAAPGVDKLVERIVALGVSTPGLVVAATDARERARKLTAEIGYLEQTMQSDPDLRFQLSGVQERIQGEIAEIRARLAETYAALVELDAVEQDRDALPEAVERLRAELEVSSAVRRAAVKDA